MKKKLSTIISENVKRLRAAHDWSQPDLARRSGVAQKTISTIENETHVPGVDKVEALARAFCIPSWALMIPDVDPTIFVGDGLGKIVSNYIGLPPDGRQEVARVSEREARYNVAATQPD